VSDLRGKLQLKYPGKLTITAEVDYKSAGCFEVTVEDVLVFSKLKEHTFPTSEAHLNQIYSAIDAKL
ncbi:hypothetical protein Ciccas_012673, partial [Cichlidogyrus casuarinus]